MLEKCIFAVYSEIVEHHKNSIIMAHKDERPIVVGIGEVVIDHYSSDNSEKLGGAPLIFAYHAAKTHCKGVIISAVGKDDGNSIEDKAIKKGVIPVFNTVDKPSGIVDVKGDPNKPEYDIKPNRAWTEIKCTEENEKCLNEVSKEAKAVYFGTLASSCGGSSKDTIDKFIEDVSKGKTTQDIIKDGFLDKYNNVLLKIYDVNLRQDEIGKERISPEQSLVIIDHIKKCNVLKVNKKELEVLLEIAKIKENDSDKAGETIMNKYSNLEILILTKREEGSIIFWRDKNMKGIFCQSIRIRLKLEHNVGAGDAMVGAFIGELLNGESIPYAYTKAVQRANMVCRDKERNSMPEIPGKDFFFSYADEDRDIVSLFEKEFVDKGITVWRDKSSRNLLDNSLWNDIFDAIERCKVFVYFSSKNANESPNVKQEIEKAKQCKKKTLIIKLDESSIDQDWQVKWYQDFYFYNICDKIFNQYKGQIKTS